MDISFVLRKFKKSISGFTVLALLTSFVSFVGVAQAATFTDTAGHWGEAYIEALYSEGVVSGNPDGSFAPDNYLNRAELSKMLVLGYTEGLDTSAPAVYPDVATTDWYAQYANDAYQKGIMTGEGNGTFNGASYVNRAVLMQAVYNAAGLTASSNTLPFTDVMSSDWFNDAVNAGYWWSVIDGKSSTSFDPAGMATRAEASKVIYNGWYPVERTSTDGGTGGSTAGLSVSLASDTPASATIPSRATSVELVAYDFMASGDDVVINSVTLNQYGVSSMNTDHSVYAYAEIDGVNTRLTSGQTINSSTYDVKFNNLGLEVGQNETVRFSVRMDVGGPADSSKEVGLQIKSADLVESDASSVSGSFPIKGNLFSIATDAVGTITIEKNGTVTNPQVGADGVEVAKFKVTASTEGAMLRELGLYVSGSINTTDVENFQLFVSGETTPLATVSMVDSMDVVRFMIDDYEIAKGATKSFVVTADFNTGRTSDTVKIYVDENTDLVAIGDLYGFGMYVDRTGYDASETCDATASTDCTFMTLEGGDVTISSNGPSASDIAINGRDVVLMNFTIASVTDVTFKNMPVGLLVTETATASGLLNTVATSNFTDIKIINSETGAEVFSAVDSNVFTTDIANADVIDETEDAAQAFHLYTDDITMSSGEELNLSLTADVANNASLSGDTIVASVQLGAIYPELRDVNNKVLTNASVLVPNSAVTSKTHTLRSPSLALSLASTPVTKTYVKGSQDVSFSGLVFACGEASKCRVTDVTVAGHLDANNDGVYNIAGTTPSLTSYVGSISLVDADGNTVAGPKSVNNTTWATSFTNVNWTMPAGSTEVLYVVGDLSTDATAAGRIAFSVTGSTGVTAEDKDGNSITASGTPNTSQSTYVLTSSGGGLTVTVDASTAKEDIVVAGTSNVAVSKFKFESTDEAFVVNKLSINARQSGVGSANLGDYDNNVSSITLSYEDMNGDAKTANGFLTDGTASFTGLSLYVPADDSANMSVSATLNTISGGATAGEFVDLNIAFNNFEATAQSSGETYKANKLDSAVASTSDLDFGTMTFVDTSVDHAATSDIVVLGTTDTVTVPNLGISLPVGTIVKFGVDTTSYAEATEILVILTTKYTSGDTTLTGFVANYGADGETNGLDVFYALPGTGYLTNAKQMHVYESKPTLSLASSSPSGSKNVSEEQDVFVFNISANSQELVQIRTAKELVTCLAGNSTVDLESATHATAAQQVDGSSCNVDNLDGNGDFVAYSAPGLEDYDYASFWIRWTDSAAGDSASLDVVDIALGCNTDNTGAVEHSTALTSANILGAPTALLEEKWYHVYDVAIPAACTTTDEFINIVFTDSGDTGPDHADDDVFIDRVVLYNEKLTIDGSSDADFDADLDADGNHEDEVPVLAYLKEGGSTVATAYFDINARTADVTADASSAIVHFYPIEGTNGAIEIAKGTTKTFTLVTNTADLIHEDTGSDDPVSFSIGLGSSTDGTVTAGDFWWHETNATVKWLGNVSSSTLFSNTLTY